MEKAYIASVRRWAVSMNRVHADSSPATDEECEADLRERATEWLRGMRLQAVGDWEFTVSEGRNRAFLGAYVVSADVPPEALAAWNGASPVIEFYETPGDDES